MLADVPCSGDGTLRKNVILWQKFTVDDGKNIHALQLRIATQGLALLKVGGLLVYSTCSLNPIEDEAVVAELLRQGAGAFELVDARDSLPGLTVRQGLESWSVPVRKKRENEVALFRTQSELDQYVAEHKEDTVWDSVNCVKPSMFAPAEPGPLNLSRCMRVLPHDQDTGGFFVAALRKTKPWPSDKPGRDTPVVSGSREPKGRNSNDVWFDDIDDATWTSLKESWGLNERCRRNLQVRIARAEDVSVTGHANKIFWVGLLLASCSS